MRDTDLLLALVAAAPDSGTVLTQAHPAFGAAVASIYGGEADPMKAVDRDVRALVATGDVVALMIDGDPNARGLIVTSAGRCRAQQVNDALAYSGPMPVGGA